MAGVVTLFVAMSALVLAVGVSFLLAGAWIVLSFAVLEMFVIGALCHWLYRHLDDCELVIVESDRIKIIKRRGTEALRYEFSRYWARVAFDRESNAPGRARLLVGSHGKFVSVADDINEADRAIVARKLKQLLRAPV